MKRMGLHRTRFVPLLGAWLLLAAMGLGATPACLPEDPPVDGRLLWPGIHIEGLEFREIGGQPWVQFEVRKSRARDGMGGNLDVRLVNWLDPSQHRLLLANRAERAGWPRLVDGVGAFYYMTDDRLLPVGNGLPVGTLVRLRPEDSEPLERIPDVIGYSPDGGPWQFRRFLYRRFLPETQEQEVHLRTIEGKDRNLGVSRGGQVQLFGEKIYLVSGEDFTLYRYANIDAEPEKIRSRVSSFMLDGAERFALLTISEAGKVKTILRELASGVERPLPVDQPSNWLGMGGDIVTFGEAATATSPARLHFWNSQTDQDDAIDLPAGVPDVRAMMGRPGSREVLLFDRRGVVTIFRRGEEAQFETTTLRPTTPMFSQDGRYLLFLDPEPPPPPPAVFNNPTGLLMVQDANDWQSPPRLLSPRGTSVSISPRGFDVRRDEAEFPLYFWARYGLGGSDLYLANHVTGATVKVATGIGAVSIGDREVLGVVRVNQDLTGDLVRRDFVRGDEVVIEHGVSDVFVQWGFPELGDLLAFVVRERRPESRRNGLWARKLERLPEPDGGTVVQQLRSEIRAAEVRPPEGQR